MVIVASGDADKPATTDDTGLSAALGSVSGTALAAGVVCRPAASAQWHLLYLVATLARAWEQAELQPKTHGLATVAT